MANFCRKCGENVEKEQTVCRICGFEVHNGYEFCHNCGAHTKEGQKICVECGFELLNKAKNKVAITKKFFIVGYVIIYLVSFLSLLFESIFGTYDFGLYTLLVLIWMSIPLLYLVKFEKNIFDRYTDDCKITTLNKVLSILLGAIVFGINAGIGSTVLDFLMI